MNASSVPQLETDRLLLRGWRESDLSAVVDMNSDPDVMRYIGNGAVATEQQCRDMIANQQRQWEDKGFGFFAVQLRSTGETIGLCGLNVPLFYPEILPAVEIGWRLRRAHWGKGYATEAASAALEFGFTDRDLSTIYGFANSENTGSLRIMDKIGMTFTETVHITKYDLTAQLYTARRA